MHATGAEVRASARATSGSALAARTLVNREPGANSIQSAQRAQHCGEPVPAAEYSDPVLKRAGITRR